MNNQIENADQNDEFPEEETGSYDYAHVNSVARIALYDDLRSAPRVTEINPAPTGEFIESLASKIYEQAKSGGGTIPYTVIREVSENFIHARFAEVTVSILDGGNTIRFADQGPGIGHKEKAQLPGFTSAIEPMKHYIRGVGSGLPIVKEYLDFSHGTISIEDNLGTGSVVTISLKAQPGRLGELEASAVEPGASKPDQTFDEHALYGGGDAPGAYQQEPRYPLDAQHPAAPMHNPYASKPAYAEARYAEYPQASHGMPAPQPGYYQVQQPAYGNQGFPVHQGAPMGEYPYAAGTPAGAQGGMHQYAVGPLVPPLSQRERDFLPIFLNEGALGVTDLSRLTGVPQSSTYVTLQKLEQAGLIEKTVGQKRILTEVGYQVANSL